MSSDSDASPPGEPAPKRPRKHRFKKLTERIANVDVDVYRSLAPRAATPAEGSTSFFQEKLAYWDELCAAQHWLALRRPLAQRSVTLAQVVHHAPDLAASLCAALSLEALLSLEPVLELLPALARDLGVDFLPHYPLVVKSLTALVDSGLDRHPEELEKAFACLSHLIKTLLPHLLPDIPAQLAITASLRHHRADHVRTLAAQAVALLLRRAPSARARRAAVRAALAEAASRPSPRRLHAAASLLSQACAGAGRGLHSRAPALLRDALDPALLGPWAARAAEKRGACGAAVRASGDARWAVAGAETVLALLRHVQRGRGGAVWETLLDMRLGGDAEEGEAGEEHEVALSLDFARTLRVGVLAKAVGLFGGAKVEDYGPIFGLLERWVAALEQAPCQAPHALASADALLLEQAALSPDPRAAGLALALALVQGHSQRAGASAGPEHAAERAAAWAPLLRAAPRPAQLRFLRGCLTARHAGVLALGALRGAALEALVQALGDAQAEEEAWALLLLGAERLLRPEGESGEKEPPAQAASAARASLARLRRIVLDFLDEARGSEASPKHWAALHLLPRLSSPLESATALACFARRTEAYTLAQRVLRATARRQLVALARGAGARDDLAEQARAAWTDLLQSPGEAHAVRAACEALDAALGLGAAPQVAPADEASLGELLGALQINLSGPQASLRLATLRLVRLLLGGAEALGLGAVGLRAGAEKELWLLDRLQEVEETVAGEGNSRAAVVTLGQLRTELQARRVRAPLRALLVHHLVGVLHLRYAPLWLLAKEALVCCLGVETAETWPLVLRALATAQDEVLRNGQGGEEEKEEETGEMEERGMREEQVDDDAASELPSVGQNSSLDPLSRMFARQCSALVSVALDASPAAMGLEILGRPSPLPRSTAEMLAGSAGPDVRLTQLLQTLAQTRHGVLHARAVDWAPLLARFSQAAEQRPVGDAEGRPEPRRLPAKRQGASLHALLKEWLGVLPAVGNLNTVAHSKTLHAIAMSHVGNGDPTVQIAALNGLRGFKLAYLQPYMTRVLRLADDKTLRGELAAFPLSVKAASLARAQDDVTEIAPEHRAELVALVVRVLFPKLRRKAGRFSGKGSTAPARAAILNFLAAAEPHELRTLLELSLGLLLGNAPASLPWRDALGTRGFAFWLSAEAASALESTSTRQRLGYLNSCEDLLGHLGFRAHPFFADLLSIALFFLERAPVRAAGEQGERTASGEAEQVRQIRTQALRFITGTLARFPALLTPSQGEGATEAEIEGAGLEVAAPSLATFWARFLSTMRALSASSRTDAASARPPPLFDLTLALVREPVLCRRFLCSDGALEAGSLLEATLRAAAGPACSRPSRKACLDAVEALVSRAGLFKGRRFGGRGIERSDPDPAPAEESDAGVALDVLKQQLGGVLAVLQACIAARRPPAADAEGPPSAAKAPGGGNVSGAKPPDKAAADDAVASSLVLAEALSGLIASEAQARVLSSAVLALITPRGVARASDSTLRALSLLSRLWEGRGVGALEALAPESSALLLRTLATLAPLAQKAADPVAGSALALCAGLLAAALGDPALCFAAETLADLCSAAGARLDSRDEERRARATLRLDSGAWISRVPFPLGGALLAHRLLLDLACPEDFVRRAGALQALSQLLGAACAEEGEGAGEPEDSALSFESALEEAVDEEEDPFAREMDAEALLSPPSRTDRREQLRRVARLVVVPALVRGLATPHSGVRADHARLLRSAVQGFRAGFPALCSLVSSAEDADFFLNIAHLQLHRRARALNRLQAFAQAPENSRFAPELRRALAPLLLHLAVAGDDREGPVGRTSAAVAADAGRLSSISQAACGALAALAARLEPEGYAQLLGSVVRLLAKARRAEDDFRPALRCVVAILKAFPYGALEDASVARAVWRQLDARGACVSVVAQEAGVLEDGGKGEEGPFSRAAVEDPSILPPATAAYRGVALRALPELEQLLVVKEEVQPPVVLAMVEALLLFPSQALRSRLTRVLQPLANALKARAQHVRDSVRAVFVQVAARLGPAYLSAVLQVLVAACPARGYLAHVFSFSTHAVVAALRPKLLEANKRQQELRKESGAASEGSSARDGPSGALATPRPHVLDPCLRSLLLVIERDLFGAVADAKEAAEFARLYAEAKQCKAYDLYELVCECVDFGASFPSALAFSVDRLADVSSAKLRPKVLQLLQRAMKGALNNPSASDADLCRFFYALADRGLGAEERARRRAARASEAAVGLEEGLLLKNKTKAMETKRGDEAPAAPDASDAPSCADVHEHYLAESALWLLRRALGSPRLPLPASARLVAPLAPLLARALQSRHAASASLALGCLQAFAGASDAALRRAAAEAARPAHALLRGCSDPRAALAQDCMRFLTALLRSGADEGRGAGREEASAYAPTAAQTRFVLSWAFKDAAEQGATLGALALLRALVKRRALVPEVYDVMREVQVLAIRTLDAQARAEASAALLEFLLHYPLGERRLRQHRDLLLANLAYPHEHGRLAVLDALLALAKAFPQPVLDDWAEALVVALLPRAVGDESAAARKLAKEAISALLPRVSGGQLDDCSRRAAAWARAEGPALARAGAQLLGLLADVPGGLRRGEESLEALAGLLQREAARDWERRFREEGALPVEKEAQEAWQPAYQALLVLEKLLAEERHASAWGEKDRGCGALSAICRPLCSLLLHEHLWVQRAAARCLGLGLSRPAWNQAVLALEPDAAGKLAHAALRQLECPLADAAQVGQALKLLVFLMLPVWEREEAQGLWKEGVEDEGDGYASDASEASMPPSPSTSHSSAAPLGHARPVGTREILRRAARLAADRRGKRAEARAAALKLSAAASMRLGPDRARRVLADLVAPAVRVLDAAGPAQESDQTRALAEEVAAHLRELAGAEATLEAMASAREMLLARRASLASARATQVFTDPAAAAQRRIGRQLRKREARKRASQHAERLRGAGIKVKGKGRRRAKDLDI